ncbi:hypothetical protein ACJX0J_025318, partial [Zea mays]
LTVAGESQLNAPHTDKLELKEDHYMLIANEMFSDNFFYIGRKTYHHGASIYKDKPVIEFEKKKLNVDDDGWIASRRHMLKIQISATEWIIDIFYLYKYFKNRKNINIREINRKMTKKKERRNYFFGMEDGRFCGFCGHGIAVILA